ncbi:putative DMT superfamily transporter inner membrane protein [Halalkalicoccus paucihalophilus]|uniref:Putative DMT superfamily transporter inner membrane protein n=1 Tax=Halalkalicoccus paucihalophilus TaxID=1008153 RepID=A0A151ACF9_9EURY|nr:EamA family transporter [Halalkalicoccus paucihalophilus]KYH25192.1 putative DMT superfamily transporter inner membrane protein [Halalkalicoccus paucihalophilus]
MFLATAVFFGGTFVAAKAGIEYMPPLLFVALRFDIAAVLLLGYVLLTHSREEWVPRTRADVAGIAAAGLFSIGLANAMLFLGQQYVSSAVASIVFSLNPILTPVFAAVLLSDERLSAPEAVGMVVALLGVAIVIDLDPANLLTSAGPVHAILLLGAIGAALGGVLIRRADASMPSTARTAWGLPVGALLCHVLALSQGEHLAAIEWTSEGLVALGYVAVFSGALAYIAYFGLLDEIGAIRTNLAFYLVPVVAALGGWVFLGEAITPVTIVGFLVVFAGFAILNHGWIGRELAGLRSSFGTDAHSSEGACVVGENNWNEQD